MRRNAWMGLVLTTGFLAFGGFAFEALAQDGPLRGVSSVRFAVQYSESLLAGTEATTPLDGRLLLMLSNDPSAEPRFQLRDGQETQLVFGVDVSGWRAGSVEVLGPSIRGYPLDRLSDVPPGTYRVQALLNRYETFKRADGHVVSLPPDQGEGQKWNRKPGNLYCEPFEITIDGNQAQTVAIVLDQIIPPFDPPQDTKYLKHIRIQSDMLTEFWGRPVELGAIVLLPEGFDEHPDARYPLMIYHGHFHRVFYTPVGFRETPPGDEVEGYTRTYEEASYQFYRDWTGPDFPRMILVTIQHANPYYDDSYAVNSANLGPYGDAITYELIPHIEKVFRGLGQGWARFLYGGSTGGWEALAAQILYPDQYNGAWASCPDPVDFRAYTVVNLYEDSNAYFDEGPWKRTERPGHRNYLGHVSSTMRDQNLLELTLGTRTRSGGQWDIWEAVFGPVGEDGYPRRIWDKRTGVIDPEVAAYWRENYDLRHILERDWDKIGADLEGKLHIYVGDMDSYYLNNAVYFMQETLEKLQNPAYGGEVAYGDRFEHCWSGDPDNPNSLSRLTYNQRFAPLMIERLLRTAPEGADLTSWRY